MDSLTTRFQKQVFEPYLDLLKAEYRIHPTFDHARQMWEAKLTADELVNGPYLEKSQIYQEGEPLSGLPLHESTKATVLKRLAGRSAYSAQFGQAFRSIPAGYSGHCGRGRSEATLEFFS
jgi:hypothetical protein